MTQVVDGSPAARAGLRAKDVLIDVGGEPVRDVSDVQRSMGAEAIAPLSPSASSGRASCSHSRSRRELAET